VENATAFILVGGKSSRMGSDKALLSLGGQSLLTQALLTASAVASTVRISGSKDRYAKFGDVVEDIYRDCGPLGGIHAALSATSTDLNLMLSVDMPRMTSEFLKWLLERASASPELILVPDAAGGPQPLCAVYRPGALPAVTQALQSGKYKIGRLFSKVPTRVLTEQEIVSSGFSVTIFQNVNTPDEYKALVQDAGTSVASEEKRPR
jgi:molybdopterin-guanine dinucleotide biosynthesis protein A